MSAPVEKRHREIAALSELSACDGNEQRDTWPAHLALLWVQRGDPWDSIVSRRLLAGAQALADLEAATRAKAIRDCADALSECEEVNTDEVQPWLLNHFAADLSLAKEPGR